MHRRFDSLLLDVLRVIDEDSAKDEAPPDFLDTPGDGSLVRAAPPPESPEDIVKQKWETARSMVGPSVDEIIMAALTTRRLTPLLSQGIGDFEPWREVILGLLETATTLCPETSRGVFEYASTDIGIGLAWDAENDIVLFMAEPLTRDGTTVAWFRHRLSTLARCFTSLGRDSS